MGDTSPPENLLGVVLVVLGSIISIRSIMAVGKPGSMSLPVQIVFLVIGSALFGTGVYLFR